MKRLDLLSDSGSRWIAILGCVVALGFGSVLHASALSVLVPAYFYPSPGSAWDALNQAAQRVPLMAIMNPNNGPSTSRNPDYARAVEALRNAGGSVIGYVHTSYTSRSLAAVKTDVDRYDAFYTIDGVFVDEMTNDSEAAHLAYYEELYNYIKAKRRSYAVVGNPGINSLERYLVRPVADALVTFESNSGYPQYAPDPWTGTRDPSAFSHLCYAVAAPDTMTNFIQLAVARNAGLIYVTDDLGNNPWDTLPTYWWLEVGLVEELNRQAARTNPPRLSVSLQADGALQVDVAGAPGRYLLQVSTNLALWQPVATNISTTGRFSLSERPTAASHIRLFRAEQ